MKSYTDIEQSKKLAEILPIESADMMWDDWNLIDEGWKINVGYYPEIEKDYGGKCYPAWSLAALLNYLREIDFFPEIDADEFMVTMSINYYNEEEGSLLAPVHNIKVNAETLIDACVEMIFKLNEQNLIND